MNLPGSNITKSSLKSFTKNGLIRLVLGLYQENLLLKDKLVQLEQKINKPQKDSSNSSFSPSSDQSRKRRYFKRKRSGRKPGRQRGHIGETRKWNDNPDEIIKLQASVCTGCGGLLDENGECIERRQVIDIPPIIPQIIEYQRMETTCNLCGTLNKGEFSQYAYSTISFGRNLHALTSMFFHVNYGSYERTQKFLEDTLNLHVSEGTINSMLNRVDEKLTPCTDRIRFRLLMSDYVGSDETGTFVNKDKYYNWIFQNEKDVLITLSDTRSFSTVEQTIGNTFDGAWISDRYAGQLKIKTKYKQLCLPHIDRDLEYVIEAERLKLAYKYRKLIKKVMSTWNAWYKYKVKIPAEKKILIITQLYNQLAGICKTILEKVDDQYSETKKLFKSLYQHRNHLLTCLKLGIPFHNNDSERPLRHNKNKLKINGGFRTVRGAIQYANFMSVYHTARRRNINAYEAIYKLIG